MALTQRELEELERLEEEKKLGKTSGGKKKKKNKKKKPAPGKKVDPKPDSKVDPKPDPKPKVDPKPDPKPKVDPKPDPKVDPKPDPKVDPKPDPKVDPKPDPAAAPTFAAKKSASLPDWAKLLIVVLVAVNLLLVGFTALHIANHEKPTVTVTEVKMTQEEYRAAWEDTYRNHDMDENTEGIQSVFDSLDDTQKFLEEHEEFHRVKKGDSYPFVQIEDEE